MASLKEVKDRIDSVKSTMKITAAMKMIASAKLRKSQLAIASFLPYSAKLNDILINLLSSDANIDLPYTRKRDVKKVAVVAFSSNTSLCGAFNTNILKKTSVIVSDYSKEYGAQNVEVYAIGKKVYDFASKEGLNVRFNANYLEMADRPKFELVKNLSEELVDRFLSGDLDKILLIYTHSITASNHKVLVKEHLPFDLDANRTAENKDVFDDYILEPSIENLLASLIPKVLASNLFAALLDSNASENGARTVAMQVATDNAGELVGDLTIEYNKNRQAAITGELLDILGGTAALQ